MGLIDLFVCLFFLIKEEFGIFDETLMDLVCDLKKIGNRKGVQRLHVVDLTDPVYQDGRMTMDKMFCHHNHGLVVQNYYGNKFSI